MFDVCSTIDLSNIVRLILDHLCSLFVKFYVKHLDVFLFIIGNEDAAKRAKGCIICSPVIDINDIAVIRALNYLGSKIVAWQHGGNYGYMDLPVFLYHDIVNCNIFLAYGSSVKNYFEANLDLIKGECYQKCSEVITIGSYSLSARSEQHDKVGLKNKSCKLRVAYICRDYQKARINLANGFVITSMLYYALQKRILSTLGELKNVDVVVRPHPSDSNDSIQALSSWISRSGFKNIELVRNIKFSDFLRNIDLVILDFPSTTFLEILLAKVPVIVFHENNTYQLVRKYFDEVSNVVKIVENTNELCIEIRKVQESSRCDYTPYGTTNSFIIDLKKINRNEESLWRSILN